MLIFSFNTFKFQFECIKNKEHLQTEKESLIDKYFR